MNPGELLPVQEDRGGGLGRALQERLAQLAARLERLTADTEMPDLPVAAAAPAVQQPAPVVAPPVPMPAAVAERPSAAPVEAGRDGAPADRPTAQDRLRSIRDRIEQLKSRPSDVSPPVLPPTTAVPPAAAVDVVAAPVDVAMDNDFAAIAANLRRDAPPPPAAPGPPARPAARPGIDLDAAIAEISARQKMIDDGAAAVASVATPPASSGQSLFGRRRSDRAALGALPVRAEGPMPVLEPRPQPPAAPPPPAALLAPAAPAVALDDGRLDDLGRQVAAIREMVAAGAPGPALAALEAGFGRIVERLDRLDRRAADATGIDAIAQEILHRMPTGERIDVLAAEIDRLTERVAGADHRAELARIESRLATLDGKLGAPASAGAAAPAADGTRRLEAEIAGIRDAIEQLYRMLHNSGSPALARIETRLTEVSTLLESSLSDAPRADSVSDLFARLERMAARDEAAPAAMTVLAAEIAGLRERERTELANLDRHIEMLAGRLDAAVGNGAGPSVPAELEARLAALGAQVEALAAAEPSRDQGRQLEQLDAQIADIGARLDQFAATAPARDSLTQLEAQLGSIMGGLEKLPERDNEVRAVAANVARLEGMVEQGRAESLAAVHDAAREAVREVAGLDGMRSGDPALLDALRRDLAELQAASRHTDRRAGDNLDAVHDTLDRIVDRLARLETSTRAEAVAAPHAATPAAGGATVAGTRSIDEPTSQPTETSRRRDEPEATPNRDRKADFIAAARRAAQAAVDEHSAMGRLAGDPDEGYRPGLVARLGRGVANQRRPLLLAAGAVVLAIAVILVLRPFSGNPPAADAPPATPPQEVGLLAGEPAAAIDPALAPPSGVTARFVVPPVVEAAPPLTAAPPPAPTAEVAFVEPMPEEAVGSLRLRMAAASGDPAALYEVGVRYAEGRGVPRDLAGAVAWFERAAERGLAVAQYRLATLYEGGQGVAIDRTAAHDWYVAAAGQGNVQAMHNLGVMLSQGVLAAPDFSGAVTWFTGAAERGFADSQYNLGVIYARGIGVTQDLVISYQWFALAAAQGDTDAAGRRDDVAAALTADQLAAGRTAVSAWTATPTLPAANEATAPAGGWDAPEQRADVVDRQELVRVIQALLTERGYDPGPADGLEGPRTRQAVRAFQTAIGAAPTGEIGPSLLEALGGRAA